MNIEDQPKIRVVVRKRPMNKKELQRAETDIVEVRGGSSVIVRQMKHKVDLTKFIDEHHFNFDSAFDETTTNEIECVRPIVQCAFLGAKVTCFAYGQTGSGKTYTMNGDPGSRTAGMYILGAQDIFDMKERPEFRHLNVSMSFYEIYCGKLFDLLNNRQMLQAREDGKQNVNIIGLTQKKIMNVNNFMQVIEQGSAVRITSQNSTNADSSRSHAIMQISLLEGKKTFGKISFIDLAGCQRGADTIDQSKQTRIDGAQINKSLLALKECIRALDCGKSHTPFRGSKLTMVLKDSFTGFCRTLMIGNISPNSSSCQNTLNTLRYADRVKQLKKGGGEVVSKEDQLAKELMLPRMMKNKQTVEINSDGEEEPVSSPVVQNIPQPPVVQPPPMRNNPRKIQQQRQKSQRDVSQGHTPAIPKNKRYPKDENEYLREERRGVSAIQRFKPNCQPHNVSTVIAPAKKKQQRPSFTNNTNLLNRVPPHQRQESKRQQPWQKPKIPHASTFQTSSSQLLQPAEYLQWQQILQQFRHWQPQHEIQIERMSGKFEILVNYIMRQEIQVLQYHKSVIETQKNLYNEELRLYNGVLQEDKSNQEFLNYAQDLQAIVQRRMFMLGNLKAKLTSYKHHLKQHEQFQKKLFKASEKFVQMNEDETAIMAEEHEYQYPSARNMTQQVNNFLPASNYNSGQGQPFAIYPNAFGGQYSHSNSGLFEKYGIGGQLMPNKSDFY